MGRDNGKGDRDEWVRLRFAVVGPLLASPPPKGGCGPSLSGWRSRAGNILSIPAEIAHFSQSKIAHFGRAVTPAGAVFGLRNSMELWVTAQRPPRVWRRQPGYPQRATVTVLAGDHNAALLRRRSKPACSRF